MTTTVAADWPNEPYKGLVYYGVEDRLLFSGRDRDVETCIHFLAASETRILLLHGTTGCGKSSFLRAGLIPGIEENAFGYLFLRDSAGAPLHPQRRGSARPDRGEHLSLCLAAGGRAKAPRARRNTICPPPTSD